MTTKAQISEWFDRGVEQGAAYMLVLCDTYDWEDYPSYASAPDIARHRKANPGEMQKVMEIYDLKADKQKQLDQHRCMAL